MVKDQEHFLDEMLVKTGCMARAAEAIGDPS